MVRDNNLVVKRYVTKNIYEKYRDEIKDEMKQQMLMTTYPDVHCIFNNFRYKETETTVPVSIEVNGDFEIEFARGYEIILSAPIIHLTIIKELTDDTTNADTSNT